MRYTDEDVREAIKLARNKLTSSFTRSEYDELVNDKKLPKSGVLVKRYESWNEFKQEENFEQNTSSRSCYTEDIPEVVDLTREEWTSLSVSQRHSIKRRSKWWKKQLKEGCERCGYNESYYALEWHHRDPSKKEFSINKMITDNMSDEKIKKEIQKCKVLCSNCHRIIENKPNL